MNSSRADHQRGSYFIECVFGKVLLKLLIEKFLILIELQKHFYLFFSIVAIIAIVAQEYN